MILELVEVDVKPGLGAAFEAAWREAAALLLRAEGCLSVRVARGIEMPERYRILVEWKTLENHTRDFRGTPDHARMRTLTQGYYAAASNVCHFDIALGHDDA